MTEQENLDIPMIATIGLISVAVTAATVIGVRALYYKFDAAEVQRKVIETPNADADSKLAEQIAAISRYGWAERENAVVTIPIERAMRLVVEERRSQDRRGSQSVAQREAP
ncbi:MAG: hypothetical protein AAF961_01780 [Planctomycetota bacterium]